MRVATAVWEREPDRARAIVGDWDGEPDGDQDAYYWTLAAHAAALDGDTATAADRARQGLMVVESALDPTTRSLVAAFIEQLQLDLLTVENPGERTSNARATAGPASEHHAGARPSVAAEPLDGLTPHQRRIAHAVARGYTSVEIAAAILRTRGGPFTMPATRTRIRVCVPPA